LDRGTSLNQELDQEWPMGLSENSSICSVENREEEGDGKSITFLMVKYRFKKFPFEVLDL